MHWDNNGSIILFLVSGLSIRFIQSPFPEKVIIGYEMLVTVSTLRIVLSDLTIKILLIIEIFYR